MAIRIEMKHSIKILNFLFLFTAGALCQAASGNDSIILAVENSWPPYADTNGSGISTEILKLALEAVDIKLILKVYPYARVLNEVMKGTLVGGYNVTRQASTEQQFLFGKQPLLTASASFYFSSDNSLAKGYKSIADIPDGSSIGVIIDYEYGNTFEQHKHRFKLVAVSQQTQIINMLQMGRIDGAVLFDAVALYTLKNMGLEASSLFKGPLNHTSNIYVAFSKSHSRAQYFADKLDQGLLKLKKTGEYEKLLSY